MDGSIQPGYLTFEALEAMLLRCCGAVFVATPDDQSVIRGQRVSSPRANIMLEFGLVAVAWAATTSRSASTDR